MNDLDRLEVLRLAAERWPGLDSRRTRLVIIRKPTDIERQRVKDEGMDVTLETGTITLAATKLGPYWMAYTYMLDTLVLWVGYTDDEMQPMTPPGEEK